ncbi:hypothetical protein ACHQM5_002141 [Ranunculus cassubicifolius]
MEAPSDPVDSSQQISKQKGGLRTMPFIIANEAFEKVASFGLLPNMILYLKGGYHMSTASGISILSLWGSASHFLPIVGAFISDSYMKKNKNQIGLFGMVLLWLTAMIPQARPPKCDPSLHNCKSPTSGQLTLLFSAFVFMGIGAGGIRPCSLAFGAEQVDTEGNPKKKRALQTFFNWYYASATVSVLIALTIIVYVQDHLGWKIGFAIPAICMFLSGFFFMLATSRYIKAKPNKSLFTGFAQVTVAAIRKRNVPLPKYVEDGYYHHASGSKMVVPSEKLRFLNRACIIRSREKDLTSDEIATNPWSLCTVTQVEELKALLKVLPMWSTGIVMSLSMNAHSFPLLQASSMDRHLTSGFEVPAGSFTMFMIATIVIWLPLYDRLIVPVLAKITRKPYGIGLKQRMGIGIVVICLSSVVAAIVEHNRRRNAISQGFSENPQGVLDMSAMWLVPQYCLGGIAEAFYAVGQNEFYYSQFPNSMSSIATSLFGLGMAFGNLLGGVMVRVVDDATKGEGKDSWVSSNINKGSIDYYYWMLAVIGVINILYFILCSWAYGPCEGERTKIKDEDEEIKDEELSKAHEVEMVSSA